MAAGSHDGFDCKPDRSTVETGTGRVERDIDQIGYNIGG